MKNFYTVFFYCLIIAVFLLSSCKKDKDDENNNNNPPVVSGETVIATSSVTLGANGGIVSLTDGAAINIAAGVLTADTKITISKIGNEVNFAADNRYCYEITGLSAGMKVTLVFPCEKDKDSTDVGVLNYNPADISGIAPPFKYDAVQGTITVENYTLEKKSKDSMTKRRWIVEWDNKLDYGSEEKIIPMPFYSQVSESCWAADATMLTKAFKTNTTTEGEVEIKDYLKEIGIVLPKGITPPPFLYNLPKAFKKFSGINGISKTYWVKKNALRAIIAQLKENKPIIMHMPNREHAILIIGYKTFVDETGYDNFELLIHDTKGLNPPNNKEGTMYTTRKWSWFCEKMGYTLMFFLMYPDKPVPAKRTLQTICLPFYPDNNSIKFEYYKDSKKGYIDLMQDNNYPESYKWGNPMGYTFDTIPKTLKNLRLSLQTYNADLDIEKTADVIVNIRNLKKGKQTCSKRYPLIIYNDKNPISINQTIDTSEWLKNYGDTTVIPYELEVMLVSSISDLYLDGWKVKFKVKGGLPSKDYIKSYNSPPATHLIYNKYYSANVAIGISGDQFRVTQDVLYTSETKQITIKIPKITSASATMNYSLTVNFSELAFNPPNPSSENTPKLKKVEAGVGTDKISLDTGGNWTIPISVTQKNTNTNVTLVVYIQEQDKQGNWISYEKSGVILYLYIQQE
ncbi:MAG: hypothetical protein KA792_03145 [Bacteroidales bacterium]|nr:hypothetical protein [Bacteroidales bacterium]